jgi:DNA-binding transcriptional LysR family regulator
MLNMRSVDLNLLPFFEAAYEERSLSKAARRLAVTQPAVSHALARLRALFKDDLFVRHARGVTPTPVADAIYAKTHSALGLVREAVTEMRGFDPASAERRFGVFVPHPLGPMIAVALLERLRRIAPGVEVAFDTQSRPFGVQQALREGRADVAIDWLSAPETRYRHETLFRDRLVLAARAGHPALGRRATSASLREYGCVRLRPRVAGGALMDPEGALARLELNFTLEVSELLEVFMVAAASDLLGLIPHSMAEMAHRTLGLEVLPGSPRTTEVPVYLFWHDGRERDPGHRFLRRHLREVTREVVGH